MWLKFMASEDVYIFASTVSPYVASCLPPSPLSQALRVSMEEQRQRQEEETRKVAEESLQHMEQDQGR